ncbi:MAG: hypothetical protein KBF32_09930 [Chitinophagales bacterium]|nr:hypothetical protein [Chitinophagaceae bacterium]MBP9883712.1 hypothetical protein [Chitinophagales bacterium]
MLKKIRKLIHFYLLRKELKFHQVERKVVNLRNAREIGLLFDASDTDVTAQVNLFAESLRKERKKIFMLGYYNFPKPAINLHFPYFNRKNVTWYYEPNGLLVEEFIARKFDILISAHIEENLPLEYISTMSQSTFRVGQYDKSKTYAYDFMIDLKGEKDLRKLMDQVKYYIEMV